MVGEVFLFKIPRGGKNGGQKHSFRSQRKPVRPTQNRLQAKGKSLPKPRATGRGRDVGQASLPASMMTSWWRLLWFVGGIPLPNSFPARAGLVASRQTFVSCCHPWCACQGAWLNEGCSRSRRVRCRSGTTCFLFGIGVGAVGRGTVVRRTCPLPATLRDALGS